MAKKEQLILVSVIALLEEPTTNSPVVILHDPKGDRVLPIWIGEGEARAIAIAFQSVEISRPLTHTLLGNVVLELGARILRVVIERIEGGTYFARIDLEDSDGEEVQVDSRPSDSVALALEVGAPLFVAKSVLDAAAQDNPFPSSDVKIDQAKEDFSEEELEDLKDLLEKAREREEGLGS